MLFKKMVSENVRYGRISWKRHALERILERNILRKDVTDVLQNGEVIEEYPDDHPFPSILIYGKSDEKPLHVVVSIDTVNKWCYIITVYRPDLKHFESDYKTRKK